MTQFSLKSVAAAALLATAALGSAHAAPGFFTVDSSAITGVNRPLFQANQILGNSSELLRLDAATNTVSANSGWVQFSSFTANGAPVLPGTTRLGVDYGLYLTFNLTAQLISGTFGDINSEYNVTSINVGVWADKNLNTTFQQASAVGTGTEASVTGGFADDIYLGGSVLLAGVANLNALGGVGINVTSLFALCNGVGTADLNGETVINTACAGDTGSKFFVAPVPFYSLSFSSFNNTSQGIERNGDLLAITQAIGNVDFARLPEPGSVALAGLALLAAGAASRRRKSA